MGVLMKNLDRLPVFEYKDHGKAYSNVFTMEVPGSVFSGTPDQ
jgi:hypothetical protein